MITPRARQQLVRIYVALIVGLFAIVLATTEYAFDSGLWKVLAEYSGLRIIGSVLLVYFGAMFGLIAGVLRADTQKMLLFGAIGMSLLLSGAGCIIREIFSASVQEQLHWLLVTLDIGSGIALIAGCALGLTMGLGRRKVEG